MKQHRKCDQAKFKKRKARVLENRKEKVVRQRALDHQMYLIREKNRENIERMEEFKREWHKQEQALVNILARRLCQLSPEYAKELRGKEAIRHLRELASIWGGSGMFLTRIISEEPFMAITDKSEECK
jgi:hypothetical protein